jgi:hypothetical protein
MRKIVLTLAAAWLAAGCASDGDHDGREHEVETVEETVEEPADEEHGTVADHDEALPDVVVTPAPPEVAERQFEMLKALEGTWVASGAEGSVPDAQIRYEVTSAGHAVVETIFPGAEHEMVSVYHLDNGKLVMTHYCAMGNQPFFTSEAGTADDEIKFTCTGAHNTASHGDPHMHEGVFTIGDGTLHTEWTMFQDLNRGGTVVIDLVRGDM